MKDKFNDWFYHKQEFAIPVEYDISTPIMSASGSITAPVYYGIAEAAFMAGAKAAKAAIAKKMKSRKCRKY